jgi:hypothetical protein
MKYSAGRDPLLVALAAGSILRRDVGASGGQAAELRLEASAARGVLRSVNLRTAATPPPAPNNGQIDRLKKIQRQNV